MNWLIGRLVVERIATLEEVTKYYDLDEVLAAHEWLDFREEIDATAARAAADKMKQGKR
ncbi:MAG: hypothetical protein GWM98_04720 [Nitrospinaceae bacterium]|nr:hypothetical protein [Nitrospinaceae bacterium]